MKFDDLTPEAQQVALEETQWYVIDDCERVQMEEWEIDEALSPSGLRSYARECLAFDENGEISYTK